MGRARLGPALGLLGVVLLVAGGATVVAGVRAEPGADQVVVAYFDALSRGDAAHALSYGPPPVGDRRFLTDAVLAVQRRVGSVQRLTLGPVRRTGDSAVVSVDYVVVRADVSSTSTTPQHAAVSLHRHSQQWRLDATTVPVTVSVANAGHRATLAGAAIPRGPVALFPGAVPVEFDPSTLEQAPASDLVGAGSLATGLTSARIVAQVSESGRVAFEGGVRAAAAACLRHAATAPTSCPLTPNRSGAVPGSVRGELGAVTFSGAPTLISATVADAGQGEIVEMSGTVAVRGTYQVLDYQNLARTRSGTVVIPFTADASATGPGVVRWKG